MGSSNVFAGKVSEITINAVGIATSAGQFDVAPNPAKVLAQGDKATFVVSGDRVQLSNSQPSTSNTMRASVVGEEFVGATAVIHLEGDKGLELKAQKSHDELVQLNLTPGATIWVSWRVEASHILPGGIGGWH
ncbi:TOBE domain-containing protein [Mesorhizobium sp. AR02]|uniref:TOBE domain-containing protein n=1 Tax=Mesorhizobium sp. AR02 TaxID=2865837 RepID=UPI00215FB331|nr:TOBE domain-containing protein [Mesorhizobium sp. AR02]UVK51291.1 TOBE domain-containing protein [Mesorhizobium sp. AR02]